jgi:hypothetical protein
MIVLYAAASLYVLWVLYLAVMSLARARDAGTLSNAAKILGYPLLAVGVAFNVAVNWILLTVVFLEFPRESMFTNRVTRHCLHGEGWRKRLACWICHDLLDAFDPSGKHCRG